MLNVGQKVKFKVFDTLFKDVIEATGIIIENTFGKLWCIKPDIYEQLSGGNVIVHEVNIKAQYA